jgi:hypothetical protein
MKKFASIYLKIVIFVSIIFCIGIAVAIVNEKSNSHNNKSKTTSTYTDAIGKAAINNCQKEIIEYTAALNNIVIDGFSYDPDSPFHQSMINRDGLLIVQKQTRFCDCLEYNGMPHWMAIELAKVLLERTDKRIKELVGTKFLYNHSKYNR